LKRLILAMAFALFSGSAAADGIPFFADRDVPDYVASMGVWQDHIKPPTHARTVVQHRGWTRVEELKGSDRLIFYSNFFDHALLTTVRTGDDDFTWIRIRRAAPSHDYFGIVATSETGETGNEAGEACKWWRVVHQGEQISPSGSSSFSCLSRDGIEVAAKAVSNGTLSYEIRLSNLRRKPVAAAEVRPPARLFDPEFWLKPLRDYPDRPTAAVDFEVKMSSAQADLRLLRHYPWRVEERHGKDGSVRFTVWNERENQGIRVYLAKDDAQLDAARLPLDPSQPWSFDLRTGQVDLGQDDNYSGEACRWFDMMPNVADAGRRECLTSDGLPLRIVITSGWGPGEDDTALSVKRRAIDIKEMFPPADLLDASRWGWPAQQ